MRASTPLLAAFAIALAAGCTGTLTDTSPGIQLSLRSDGDRLVLQGSPLDPSYRGRYANPMRVVEMTVTMFGDGNLVGHCVDSAGSTACPDVPFFSQVSFDQGAKLLRIWDVNGTLVVKHRCTDGDPLCAARGGGCEASSGGGADDDVGGGGGDSCTPECIPNEYAEGCFNGRDDDCDGLPDCADIDCLEKCLEGGGGAGGGGGGGTGGGGGGWPGGGGGGGDGDEAPPASCPPPPTGTDCAALEAWALDCFCRMVNDNLEAYSVDTVLDCSGFDGEIGDDFPGAGGGSGWDYEGDIACRNDLIEDAEDGVGDYVEESACPMLEINVHNWVSEADFSLRSRGYCGHSPLVLDLAGDGVSLTPLAGGAMFDLLGTGEPVECSWTQADDALLVYDANHDGLVAGARELLGNATGGRDHDDGFAALATLDQNHDGVVDGRDPAWARLYAWRDDGDAVSEPGELFPLVSVGVTALPLSSERVTGADAWDGRGNRMPLVGSFLRTDGGHGAVVDAWLQYTPATDADREVESLLNRLLGDVRR